MIATPQFVFIDPPKCATTSLRKALAPLLINHECNRGDWHRREIPDELAHLPRYAIVRHPYDRALSLYHFERRQCELGKKNHLGRGAHAYFQHWCLDSLVGFLSRCIENRGTEENPLYFACAQFLAPCEPVDVLPLEGLERAWASLALPPVVMPHERAQTYDRTLSNCERELIGTWAFEDFDRYGYVKYGPP